MKNSRILRWILLHAPAWAACAMTIVMTGWIGRETWEGRLVAGSVSVLMFYTVAMRGVARRRAGVLRQRLRATVEERTRAQRILDHVPGLVWATGKAPDRTFVGASWETITGQPPEEALRDGWLDAVHESDRDYCRSAHRLAAARQEPFEIEYRLLWADGTYHWVRDRGAPCFDEVGTFSGYVGFLIDVNHMKTAADHCAREVEYLARMNETINRRALDLVERYEDLEDARRHAEYAEQVKSDYLAALADELSAPLEDLRNVLDMFAPKDLTSTQQSYLERIRSASKVLTAAADRTRCLGDSECAEREEGTERGEFDLRRLVERVVNRQKQVAEERGLVAGSIIEDAVPVRVEGEPLRLRRLLMELWATAFRLGRHGKLTLRVSRESADDNGTVASFSISLPGEQVSDAELESAYYPAESFRGLPIGLGLGPSKRLAELMGGTVGVHRDSRNVITIWAKVTFAEVHPNWEGRRSHGRLSQESVRSSLGRVLDLSMGGMRVQCTKAPEGLIEVDLSDDEETIELKADVAWTRRVGFGKHQAGLRFVELTPDTTLRLSRLATRNRLRRILDEAEAA